MKKLMFLLAAASLSSVAFAQQKSNSQNVLVGESVDVMEVPVDKYKVETNHFFDNWFFSVGGGAQVLFGDQSDLGKFKKRIAPALQISIGKWFTPGLGLRLQYSGLQSKSFSSEPSAYSKPHNRGQQAQRDCKCTCGAGKHQRRNCAARDPRRNRNKIGHAAQVHGTGRGISQRGDRASAGEEGNTRGNRLPAAHTQRRTLREVPLRLRRGARRIHLS